MLFCQTATITGIKITINVGESRQTAKVGQVTDLVVINTDTTAHFNSPFHRQIYYKTHIEVCSGCFTLHVVDAGAEMHYGALAPQENVVPV